MGWGGVAFRNQRVGICYQVLPGRRKKEKKNDLG